MVPDNGFDCGCQRADLFLLFCTDPETFLCDEQTSVREGYRKRAINCGSSIKSNYKFNEKAFETVREVCSASEKLTAKVEELSSQRKRKN